MEHPQELLPLDNLTLDISVCMENTALYLPINSCIWLHLKEFVLENKNLNTKTGKEGPC